MDIDDNALVFEMEEEEPTSADLMGKIGGILKDNEAIPAHLKKMWDDVVAGQEKPKQAWATLAEPVYEEVEEFEAPMFCVWCMAEHRFGDEQWVCAITCTDEQDCGCYKCCNRQKQ